MLNTSRASMCLQKNFVVLPGILRDSSVTFLCLWGLIVYYLYAELYIPSPLYFLRKGLTESPRLTSNLILLLQPPELLGLQGYTTTLNHFLLNLKRLFKLRIFITFLFLSKITRTVSGTWYIIVERRGKLGSSNPKTRVIRKLDSPMLSSLLSDTHESTHFMGWVLKLSFSEPTWSFFIIEFKIIQVYLMLYKSKYCFMKCFSTVSSVDYVCTELWYKMYLLLQFMVKNKS